MCHEEAGRAEGTFALATGHALLAIDKVRNACGCGADAPFLARQLEAADAALLVCHEEAGRAEVKFALATAHVLRLARERLVDKVVKDRHGQIGAPAEALRESGLTGHRCLFISSRKMPSSRAICYLCSRPLRRPCADRRFLVHT